MDLIFNELSFSPQTHPHAASGLIHQLVGVLAEAKRNHAVRTLRTDVEFLSRQLAPAYSVATWLADGTVDKDAKRLVISSASASPYVEDLLLSVQRDRLAEFRAAGHVAVGLGLAVLRNECAISFDQPGWNTTTISVDATYYDGTSSTEAKELVENIFDLPSISAKGAWLRNRALTEIVNGLDVVGDGGGLFGRLRFATTAVDQLSRLTGNEPEFVSIVRHLSALNDQAKKWATGSFLDGYPFPCSTESGPTLDMYGEERKFRCPDGSIRQFTWHSKVNINARRIYFHFDRPNEPVIVAYIGPHLRIVSES